MALYDAISDRWLIALRKREFVNPARIADAVVTCGLPYAEATRASRRQRGIVFRRLHTDLAHRLADELKIDGIDLVLMPEAEFPDFERVISIEAVHANDLGIAAPALLAIGKGGFFAWEEVRFVSVGLWEGENVHSLVGLEKAILSGATSREDHQVLASKAFEDLAGRRFDLAPYLDTHPEDAVNYERLKPKAATEEMRRGLLGRKKVKKPLDAVGAPSRFGVGNPELEARLVVSDGITAWSINVHTAPISLDGSRVAGHWMRALHALALAITERVDKAIIAPEVEAFIHRKAFAEYVVEDWESFEDGNRWLLWASKLASANTEDAQADHDLEPEIADPAHPGAFNSEVI